MTQEKGISSHMLAAYSYDPVALLKEDNPKFVGATRRSVLLQILTHIIALGMTAAVIQLSLRQCYFGDVDDTKFGVMSTNEALNAMQFAAKLHELFMVASLTAIVFHFSRSLLLGSRGLPLGLVTAPFRISAPDYLISSEFWGSFSRPRLILMLGLFLTTLLITTLSPVSAIMLVPSLDWWHIAEPYSEDRTGKGIPIIVRASRKDIWPMTVVPKYVSDCYQLANASNICPGQGLDDIKAWVSAYESSGLQPNITMTEISSGARRRLQSYADGEVDIPEVWDITDIPVFADNHDQFTRKQNETLEKYALSIGVEVLTTTTTHWMVAILGLVWNWAKDVNLGPINRAARPRLQIDKSIPVWDPLVSVRCSTYDYYDSRNQSQPLTAPFSHNRFGDTGIATTNNLGWNIPTSTWNYTRTQLNIVNFTWIDLQHTAVNASLGAVFSIPYVPVVNGTTVQSSWIVPCTVEARWISSDLSYDPTMTDLVHDNITQLEDFGQDARISIQTLNASNIIKISTEWAKLLDLPVPRARRFGPSTAMSELIQPLILRGDDYQTNPSASASYYGQKFASNLLIQSRTMSQDIATILGFVVADGLSRIGYAYDIDAMYYHNSTYADLTSLRFRVGAQSPQSNSTWTIDEYKQDSALYWTRFDLSVDRWGYGYAINSKTTVFGLIVLLTFGSIVVLYLAWWAFVTFRSSLSDWALVTTRWGSIGELLALAINSPQSVELNGTCAGIDDWDLWKAPICIREVEPQHLGLVVGKTQETHFRVRRGVRYGSLHPYERG